MAYLGRDEGEGLEPRFPCGAWEYSAGSISALQAPRERKQLCSFALVVLRSVRCGVCFLFGGPLKLGVSAEWGGPQRASELFDSCGVRVKK